MVYFPQTKPPHFCPPQGRRTSRSWRGWSTSGFGTPSWSCSPVRRFPCMSQPGPRGVRIASRPPPVPWPRGCPGGWEVVRPRPFWCRCLAGGVCTHRPPPTVRAEANLPPSFTESLLHSPCSSALGPCRRVRASRHSTYPGRSNAREGGACSFWPAEGAERTPSILLPLRVPESPLPHPPLISLGAGGLEGAGWQGKNPLSGPRCAPLSSWEPLNPPSPRPHPSAPGPCQDKIVRQWLEEWAALPEPVEVRPSIQIHPSGWSWMAFMYFLMHALLVTWPLWYIKGYTST